MYLKSSVFISINLMSKQKHPPLTLLEYMFLLPCSACSLGNAETVGKGFFRLSNHSCWKTFFQIHGTTQFLVLSEMWHIFTNFACSLCFTQEEGAGFLSASLPVRILLCLCIQANALCPVLPAQRQVHRAGAGAGAERDLHLLRPPRHHSHQTEQPQEQLELRWYVCLLQPALLLATLEL